MTNIKHPMLVGILLLVVGFAMAFLFKTFHLAQGDSFFDALLRAFDGTAVGLGVAMVLLPLVRKITR